MYLRRGVRNCCEPDWHREDNRLWNADDTAIANTRQACRVQGGFTFCTRENLPSEEVAYTMTYGFFVALFDTKYHGLVDTLVDTLNRLTVLHLPAKGVQQIKSTYSHCVATPDREKTQLLGAMKARGYVNMLLQPSDG